MWADETPRAHAFDNFLAIIRDFCRKIKYIGPRHGERGARPRLGAASLSPLSSLMEAVVGVASRPLAGPLEDVSRRRQLNP